MWKSNAFYDYSKNVNVCVLNAVYIFKAVLQYSGGILLLWKLTECLKPSVKLWTMIVVLLSYKRITRVTDRRHRQLRRVDNIYSCSELPNQCEYSWLMTFQYQHSAGHLARSCPYHSRSSYQCTYRNVCIVLLFDCFISNNNNDNNYKLRLFLKRHQQRNTMTTLLATVCRGVYY